ncbi:MAG TPA: hypothetical protein VHX88_04965, partial [Solirubrobacteraceae bacterium]|nr:hypothetical protein [Solirubrobacteraceae bacterium]
MPEPWHSRDAAAGALRVDRVEWLAATTQELLVLVHGRWHGPEAPGRPTLLVRGGERVLRVDAREILDAAGTSLIGGELPSADAPWTARFPVAMEHRPRLAAGLALLLGGSEHTLPRAVRVPAHAAGTGEAPAAQVIDRAVLAERRARRAEMVEGTLEQRAEEAEATVRDLEWRLESVEEQLAAVVREREQLRERVTGAEREVRRIRQREYAEQQLRIEAETRADAGDLELHSKIEALRRRLQDSEAEGERLREDLEDTRRELAGAQLRAGAERVALNRAREAVVGEDEMRARIDAAVAAQGEVAALRRDLEERHGALTERIAEMTERAGRLEQQLATQRSRTEVAERDRDRLAQAEGGSAARIAELEQRAAVAGHVRAELRALHEELERVRRGSEAQAERNVAAERTLIELHETLGGLRSELDRLERGKAQAQAQARRLGEELSASREALHELSRRGQADAADLARVTRESATQRAQLA